MFPLLGIAQMRSTVGDIAANVRRIIAAARQAHADGAAVLLTPQLALSGYMPADLLLRPAFIDACERGLAQVAAATAELPGLALVVGHPCRAPGAARLHDAASVYAGGALLCRHARRVLVDGGTSDDARYFVAGSEDSVFEHAGLRLGLLIGADIDAEGAAQALARRGARLLLVLDATPYALGQSAQWEQRLRQCMRRSRLPLLAARGVGGQDEWLFAGQSLALQADGSAAMRLSLFEEETAVARIRQAQGAITIEARVEHVADWQEELWRALVCALRDYVALNGFPGVVLGLSGGLDSALVLALAVDALGPERVRTLFMPSPYSAEISRIDAHEMARRVGARIADIAIGPLFSGFRAALAPLFAGLPEDTTEENLQARVRGSLLMALSNKTGAVVLVTGNKSELATGYCTLYGDMAGGFAPIRDVLKTQAFALARWRNAHDPFGAGSEPIPERIITRPPSAELRADQTDQDSLPPYELLDAIIGAHLEGGQDLQVMVAAGLPRAECERVLGLVRRSEFKRHQAATGPRVSRLGFGSEWRHSASQRFAG
ncbi:NAD+ synthase [Comamonas flocculans]|uniref:Glutamine-dependent NAD(+) synthetase n=1 Tax=Comamonas flocculans TaxID=2597701 RepID=A0A5B8RT82_9BURK|nr:NAD+ synthase [Comamonas flocculans]QEA11934.1 NAD+ synthase [Comamonas flocculans]